jgi:hypothetical protein
VSIIAIWILILICVVFLALIMEVIGGDMNVIGRVYLSHGALSQRPHIDCVVVLNLSMCGVASWSLGLMNSAWLDDRQLFSIIVNHRLAIAARTCKLRILLLMATCPGMAGGLLSHHWNGSVLWNDAPALLVDPFIVFECRQLGWIDSSCCCASFGSRFDDILELGLLEMEGLQSLQRLLLLESPRFLLHQILLLLMLLLGDHDSSAVSLAAASSFVAIG